MHNPSIIKKVTMEGENKISLRYKKEEEAI